MIVRSSTRRRAVLDIYQAHRRPRGGSLTARELELDWKQTGLRRSDLELALKEMLLNRMLLLKRAHDGPCYELTYLGERAMHLVMAGGPLAMVQDWLTLRRAKRRVRHQAATASGPRNRRADDRSDAVPAAGAQEGTQTARR